MDNNRIDILLKSIINSQVIRYRVFNHVSQIHLLLDKHGAKYKWKDILSSFELLSQFGCVNELKYRLENEPIDKGLFNLFGDNYKKHIVREYKINVDHRLNGLVETACTNGRLNIIKYLNEHYHDEHGVFGENDMFYALEFGKYDIVSYLYQNRTESKYTYESIVSSIIHGSKTIDIAKSLLVRRNSSESSVDYDTFLEGAIVSKYQPMEKVKLLIEYGYKPNQDHLISSIRTGYTEMARYLYDLLGLNYISLPNGLIEDVLEKGNFELALFLNDRSQTEFMTEYADMIASYCSFKDVKYLDERFKVTFTQDAMMSEDIDTLKYLYSKYRLEYSQDCMNNADDIRAIEYLSLQGLKLPEQAFLRAVSYGDLERVKCLYSKTFDNLYVPRPDYLSVAGGNGHLEVVEFLYNNQSGSFDATVAIDEATSQGHLEVVKFLLENRPDDCSEQLLDIAIQHNRIDIVEYLHNNTSQRYSPNVLEDRLVEPEIVEFLCKNRTEGFASEDLIGLINKVNSLGYCESRYLDTIDIILKYFPDLNEEVEELNSIKFKFLKAEHSVKRYVRTGVINNHFQSSIESGDKGIVSMLVHILESHVTEFVIGVSQDVHVLHRIFQVFHLMGIRYGTTEHPIEFAESEYTPSTLEIHKYFLYFIPVHLELSDTNCHRDQKKYESLKDIDKLLKLNQIK